MHSKAQVGFAGEDLSHTSKSMGQNLSEPIRGVEYLRHYIPQAEVRQIVSRTWPRTRYTGIEPLLWGTERPRYRRATVLSRRDCEPLLLWVPQHSAIMRTTFPTCHDITEASIKIHHHHAVLCKYTYIVPTQFRLYDLHYNRAECIVYCIDTMDKVRVDAIIA